MFVPAPECPKPTAPVQPRDIYPAQRHALRRFRSWPGFHRGPRQSPRALLGNLSRYPDAVLVAGCQRSGTTMLTRVIARSAGFRGLALTNDDELDAALALSGEIDLPAGSRYCFQTTYLNERYPEYRMLGPGHRLIWVLRNPQSVIHSMLYNWGRFAFNELYDGCGQTLARTQGMRHPGRPWPLGPSRIEKACLSYSAKTSQILAIREFAAPHQVVVVDYDELVEAPQRWLPMIFAFFGEPYHPGYGNSVLATSRDKAKRLSVAANRLIAKHAEPVYRSCLALAANAGN
jgi:hypothetical protein